MSAARTAASLRSGPGACIFASPASSLAEVSVRQLHRFRQGEQHCENGRRIECRELFPRAEKACRILERFRILDSGTCDREMWIDLTALSGLWSGQVVQMRLAQASVVA